jgi:hypothetical protein
MLLLKSKCGFNYDTNATATAATATATATTADLMAVPRSMATAMATLD